MVLRSQRPGLILPSRRKLIQGAAAAVSAALLGLGPPAEALPPSFALPGRIVQPITLPTAAYMCHSLIRVANWFGPCLTVIRLSDSATKDIFWRNNVVDWLAIRTFLGPGVIGGVPLGAVSKWYDQSGNGRHALQATAINRPAISGLNTLNGVTPISMAGSIDGTQVTQSLAVTGISLASQALSVFQVIAPNTSFNQSVFWEMLDAGPTVRSGLFLFGTTTNTTSTGLCSFDQTNFRESTGLSPKAGQWQVMGMTNNASNCVHYVNSTSDSQGALSSFTLTSMNMGKNSLASGGGGLFNLGFNAVFSSVLSGTQITQLTAQLNTAFGISAYTQTGTQIVIDGNSTVTGYGTTGLDTMMYYLQQYLPKNVELVNMGIYGGLASVAATNFTANIAPVRNSAKRSVYLLFDGANDITAGATGTTAYNSCKTALAAAKSAGFTYTGLASVLYQASQTAPNKTGFDLFNTLAAAGAGVDFDIYMDLTGDPRIFGTTPMSDPTISPDGLHLTSLGQNYYIQDIAPTIGALVA